MEEQLSEDAIRLICLGGSAKEPDYEIPVTSNSLNRFAQSIGYAAVGEKQARSPVAIRSLFSSGPMRREEFLLGRSFHPACVDACCAAGAFPMSVAGSSDLSLMIFAYKLHTKRAIISLNGDAVARPPANTGFHVSRSNQRRMKKSRFHVTVNKAFEEIAARVVLEKSYNWLCPPLIRAFRAMKADSASSSASPYTTRSVSFEVWDQETGKLVAGELGLVRGRIYTSLTGFSVEPNGGAVQLAALGFSLTAAGFTCWDLGMMMRYKRELGAFEVPRKKWIEIYDAEAAASSSSVAMDRWLQLFERGPLSTASLVQSRAGN